MARKINISVIGPEPPVLPAHASIEESVAGMIEYWHTQFQAILPAQPDLIVMPEACDRYANHEPAELLRYYHVRGDRIRDFVCETAAANNCYIAYSAVRELEDGSRRNSTQIIDRQGNIVGIYNKNHVVISEKDDSDILYGREAPLFQCDFGTVGCAICFDLNFDELRLRYARQRPDLILFSSVYHGGLMQNYWAYSCRAHFAGCIAGRPPCSITSPVGSLIAASTNYFDYITDTINLDCCVAHLDFNQEKLKSLKAAYGPHVLIQDPGFLGSVLITSESSEKTVLQMVAEFEIELLDDYWRRTEAHRDANLSSLTC